MALHPSPNFPGRTQEGILTQLLRKKLEPDVEELVEQGRETARLVTPEGLALLQEVWDECRQWTQQRVAEYVAEEADDVYTKEEREAGVENVRTGLKRDLESDEEDDDDDDDSDDDDDNIAEAQDDAAKKKPGAPEPPQQLPRGPEPETLMWFAARGDFALPPNIEFERKVDVYRGLQGVGVFPNPALKASETNHDAMQP